MLPQRALGIALVSLATASCGQDVLQPEDPAFTTGDELRVETDAARYTLEAGETGWRAAIGFALENASDETISLMNCRGGYALHLEKKQGSEWVRAWSPILLMCLSPPIEIRPGTTRADTLHLHAAFPGTNIRPQFEVAEIDGTYRLVIDAGVRNYNADGPPWGEPVPLEQRTSNEFELSSR